jgi:hypothetical protein
MKIFFAVAPVFLAASTAFADLVLTDQISEAMQELVEKSTCRGVLRVVAVNQNPFAAPTDDFLRVLGFSGFVCGYAAAKRQPPKLL